MRLAGPRLPNPPPYGLHVNDPLCTVEDLKPLLYGTWEVEGFDFLNKFAGNISPAIIRGGIIRLDLTPKGEVRDWRGCRKNKIKKRPLFSLSDLQTSNWKWIRGRCRTHY